MCTTGPFNLSHTSLTSFDARESLRNMKHTDPVFWEELSAGKPAEPVVGESVIEDDVVQVAEFERDGVVAALERDEDDSDLSCDVVVASTVTFRRVLVGRTEGLLPLLLPSQLTMRRWRRIGPSRLVLKRVRVEQWVSERSNRTQNTRVSSSGSIRLDFYLGVSNTIICMRARSSGRPKR